MLKKRDDVTDCLDLAVEWILLHAIQRPLGAEGNVSAQVVQVLRVNLEVALIAISSTHGNWSAIHREKAGQFLIDGSNDPSIRLSSKGTSKIANSLPLSRCRQLSEIASLECRLNTKKYRE